MLTLLAQTPTPTPAPVATDAQVGGGLVAIAVVFGLVGFFVVRTGRAASLVVGKDKRPSTSKLQVVLWTVVVGAALAFLLGAWRVEPESFEFGDVLAGSVTNDYLILLGGPFAAAVASAAIVSSSVEKKRLQKVASDKGSKKGGTTTDDSGNVDLVDVQYLLFNVIALAYVVVQFVRRPLAGLPDIPPTLLGLTGTAAAAYVGNKATLTNSPVVQSVAPSSVRPGEQVTILGQNFVPAGAPDEETDTLRGVRVLVGGTLVLPEKADNNSVTFAMPSLAEGAYPLQVRTAAGVVTDSATVHAVAFKARLDGVSQGVVRPGETVSLSGRYFTAAARDQGGPTYVFFGDQGVEATDARDDRLRVLVPFELVPGDDVAIAVQPPGGARSDTVTTKVVPPPTIGSVTPKRLSLANGLKLTVVGAGFLRGGAPTPLNGVEIGGQPVPPALAVFTRRPDGKDQVAIGVPAGHPQLPALDAGPAELVVTDSAGLPSTPYQVTIT